MYLIQQFSIWTAAEIGVTSSGGSRRGSYDTEHSDDSSSNGAYDPNKTPTRGRPFKMFQNSPKKREFGSKWHNYCIKAREFESKKIWDEGLNVVVHWENADRWMCLFCIPLYIFMYTSNQNKTWTLYWQLITFLKTILNMFHLI